MGTRKINWLDVDEIGCQLCEQHPDRDPLSIRFTELRAMVEALSDFEPAPQQQVNEQILEAIQMAWHAEYEDLHEDEH